MAPGGKKRSEQDAKGTCDQNQKLHVKGGGDKPLSKKITREKSPFLASRDGGQTRFVWKASGKKGRGRWSRARTRDAKTLLEAHT